MDELLLTLDSGAPLIMRSDALASGCTDRDLARLVRAGALHRVRPGAYSPTAVWATLDPAARHALLARAVLRKARAPSVLSHISAVPEYGGPVWGLPLDVVDVTRLDRKAGRQEAGVRQHQGLLRAEDVVRRNLVDVTSATRLAIDITTVVPVEPALCVVNHLLHAGDTDLEQIRARYTSMAHHPHTLKTDLVFRLADPRIESVGESRTLFVCWKQGVPAPEPQFVVVDDWGREVARLDFAWPDRKRWLEFDGRQKYVKFLRDGESVTDAVLREKKREEMVAELTGWRCLRITWADLADPVRLAARLRAFLGLDTPASLVTLPGRS
jgi:hypothetical protein